MWKSRILCGLLLVALTCPAWAGFRMIGPDGQYFSSTETPEEQQAREKRNAENSAAPQPAQNATPAPQTVQKNVQEKASSGVQSQHYEGKASVTTEPVLFQAGTYQIALNSKGKGYFAIILRTAKGREETVVNKIGFGAESHSFTLDEDEEVFFEIKSYGSWVIDVLKVQ